MNKQEIFDKVWAGFEKQGWEQSLDDEGHCSYRGYGGTCCAVGLLIPDSLYDPAIEGVGVMSIIEDSDVDGKDKLHKILVALDLQKELELLYILQYTHDESNNQEDLKHAFINLAKQYNLKIPNQ